MKTAKAIMDEHQTMQRIMKHKDTLRKENLTLQEQNRKLENKLQYVREELRILSNDEERLDGSIVSDNATFRRYVKNTITRINATLQ